MADRTITLIVDDDLDGREATSDFLEMSGYPAALADSGLSALNYLKTNGSSVGLILLDLDMPIMNGWEFLRRFHVDSSLSGIPVAIVSAMAVPVPDHASAILRKPVNVKKLIQIISHHIIPPARRSRLPCIAKPHPHGIS